MAATPEAKSHTRGGKEEFLFLMEISDGFTFRGLVEILCHLNTETMFVFSRTGCRCINGDDRRTILVDVTIEKRLTLSYQYNGGECVSVYVPLGKFKETLKSVVRHDNLRLYQYVGDSNLYIGRSDSDDVQYITTLYGGTAHSIDHVEYASGVESPSYVISTEELSRKFATIGRGGSGDNCPIFVDDGEVLRADVEGTQGSGSHVRIGKTQSDAPRISATQVFQLSKPSIKLLSKIQTLFKGPVQFYTEAGKPLKITCNVGTYGTIAVFLSNITAKWEATKQEEAQLKPVPGNKGAKNAAAAERQGDKGHAPRRIQQKPSAQP